MSKKDLISGKVLHLIQTGNKLPWMKITLVVSLVSAVLGAFFSAKILSSVNRNIAKAKEDARPANVKIVKITNSDCSDCFDLKSALSLFNKLNVKVKEEKEISFKSSEGKNLIKKLGIKKVPTYVLTGEIKKNNLENFVKSNGYIKDETFVFTNILPVYVDTQTGKEMGRVNATIISDSSCTVCFNPRPSVENFKNSGLVIKDIREVEWNSPEGQALISEYKIKKIPTFIFSPEIDLYQSIKGAWVNIGEIAKDKTYIATNVPLPYRDMASSAILGLVNVIYLIDSTCADCYNVLEKQKPILVQGYGLAFQSERFIEVTSQEGQDLIKRYNISKAPNLILSPEADQYSNLKEVWKNVGKVADDGWYVFTGLDQLGQLVYKDLATGQVIKPTQEKKSQGQ